MKFEVFLKKCGEITVFPQEMHITKKLIFKVVEQGRFILTELGIFEKFPKTKIHKSSTNRLCTIGKLNYSTVTSKIGYCLKNWLIFRSGGREEIPPLSNRQMRGPGLIGLNVDSVLFS